MLPYNSLSQYLRPYRRLLCFLLVSLCPCAGVLAQPGIARVEYYIDTDPGLGNATAVPVSVANPLNNLAVAIPTAGLSTGIHQFYVRAKDSLGNWSLSQRILFLKPFPPADTAQRKVAYAEWYIDADPGFGQANSVPISPAVDISNALVSINAASLSAGIHQFHIRARDSLGNWSLGQRILFLKPFAGTVTATPKIVYAEWFIDTDPGFGNAGSIPLTPATDISNAVVSINATSLTSGVHQLHVRAKDSLGNWSLAQRILFLRPYPTGDTAQRKIAYAEWYIDSDPGFGQATSIPITPAANISNLTVSINAASLSAGVHQLHVRAKDSLGSWSLDQRMLFLRPFPSAAAPPPSINYLEYFIDNDPGQGQAIPVSITADTNLSNVLIQANISALPNGAHKLHLRARDALGDWSLTNTFNFTKVTPLPLELIAFSARKADEKRVLLNWITAQEKNTDHFEVERADDGAVFATVVAMQKAAGNQTTRLEYAAYDQNPLPGNNYYRLKVVDRDGTTKYSVVQRVAFADKSTFTLLPNPVRAGMATLNILAVTKDELRYALNDVAGRTIISRTIDVREGVNSELLDFSAITPGIYILSVQGNTLNGTIRITRE